MISQPIDTFSPIDLSSVITSIDKELRYLSEFNDVQAAILFRLDGQVLEARYCNEASQDLLNVISWVKNLITKTISSFKCSAKDIVSVMKIFDTIIDIVWNIKNGKVKFSSDSALKVPKQLLIS